MSKHCRISNYSSIIQLKDRKELFSFPFFKTSKHWGQKSDGFLVALCFVWKQTLEYTTANADRLINKRDNKIYQKVKVKKATNVLRLCFKTYLNIVLLTKYTHKIDGALWIEYYILELNTWSI